VIAFLTLGIESPADWDWVAIGTLLLAMATFVLAVYNRKVVNESRQEIEVSRQGIELARQQNLTAKTALDAQTAPVLSSVPQGIDREAVWRRAGSGEPASFRDAAEVIVSSASSPDEPVVTLSIPFRNVGNGVAFITSVGVMIGGEVFDAQSRSPIVAPGEISRAWLQAGRSHSAFEHALSLALEGQDFAALIGYADAGGNPRGAISLDVHRIRPTGDGWRVRQLHLGATPEDALSRPFLSSLPL
jgi:hypothetical protein